MRGWALLIAVLCTTSAPIVAQTSAPMHPGTSHSSSSCVDVSVNDHPALSYACLNQRLAESTDSRGGPPIQLDAVTREPSNRQVGQFNFAAFSIRMGNSLGKSVVPQRPPPPSPLPLLGVPVPVH